MAIDKYLTYLYVKQTMFDYIFKCIAYLINIKKKFNRLIYFLVFKIEISSKIILSIPYFEQTYFCKNVSELPMGKSYG